MVPSRGQLVCAGSIREAGCRCSCDLVSIELEHGKVLLRRLLHMAKIYHFFVTLSVTFLARSLIMIALPLVLVVVLMTIFEHHEGIPVFQLHALWH